MKKFFNYLGKVLYYLLIIFMLWIVFKCPKMTETEIFLHIPKSVICDWEKCDH